jgi:23S rRNA G2069 N7-methylase RlmK/C1962 C5-methylase RlmI
VEEKTQAQAQMLANRLQKRFAHLKKWAQRTGAGAFRLYDRDIPEIPLVLDYYGGLSMPREAAISGALYKRPYEKDDDDEDRWLSAMKDSAALALEIDPARIFLKRRQRQKGSSQYERMGEARFIKIVSEGGLAFKVNLSDYLDTGLFPDKRLLRAMIRAEAAGKRVLNLFSYTGSFSVYAASGGAAGTDSVDLSNTYLSWARENFSLNGFSANLLQQRDFFSKSGSGAHRLIRADALDFLEKAAAAKTRWDIIILDPPVFSNSKKMSGSFDLRRDIAGLLGKCISLLSSGGKIFLSVNTRRSAITQAELKADLSQYTKNIRLTDFSDKIIDEDFKGRKIPKAFSITL